MSVFDIFAQQLVNGLVLGSFYALVALGYTMIFGVVKLLNFAHGDVYMVGGFIGLRWSPSLPRKISCVHVYLLSVLPFWARLHLRLPTECHRCPTSR